MPEPVYLVKGPEQLVVEDIIPTTADYLVVASIEQVDPTLYFGEEGMSKVPIGYRVTFTDGSFTFYPTGSAIRVAE